VGARPNRKVEGRKGPRKEWDDPDNFAARKKKVGIGPHRKRNRTMNHQCNRTRGAIL